MAADRAALEERYRQIEAGRKPDGGPSSLGSLLGGIGQEALRRVRVERGDRVPQEASGCPADARTSRRACAPEAATGRAEDAACGIDALQQASRGTEKREWVLVTTRHPDMAGGALLFWGRLSPDHAKRRDFGGYTIDLDACERYTMTELRDHGEALAAEDFDIERWRDQSDFGVRVSDLPLLGRVVRQVTVDDVLY